MEDNHRPWGTAGSCCTSALATAAFNPVGHCVRTASEQASLGWLQVAAVDEPQVHLWETGITRITRHPQNTGQLIWCLAHLLWMGNSFVLTTSAALVAHHAFACYHGDFRLERKHGKVLYHPPANLLICTLSATALFISCQPSDVHTVCHSTVNLLPTF